MQQEDVTVNFRGEQITVRVPQGTSDADIQQFLQSQAPAQSAAAAPPAEPRPTSALGAVNAFATNLSNSVLFGAPEMINRAINPDAGAMYEQMRQDYPRASAAGDIFGLAAPGALGVRAGGAVVRGIGNRVGPEAVETAGQTALTRAVDANKSMYTDAISRLDTRQAMARVSPTPENIKAAEAAQKHFNKVTKELSAIERTAQKEAAGSVLGRTARVGGQTAGGIMGLQTGAGAIGAARSPDNPMGGFQQGAQTAGQAVQQYNPLQVVPGVPQVTGGVTQIVPGVAGYGSMLMDQAMIDTDRQIREAAARRALGQPQ